MSGRRSKLLRRRATKLVLEAGLDARSRYYRSPFSGAARAAGWRAAYQALKRAWRQRSRREVPSPARRPSSPSVRPIAGGGYSLVR